MHSRPLLFSSFPVAVFAMSISALPTELLVRVLMHMEPEELSRCDQLSKLFHGPPSLVEQALRLLSCEGGLGGIPETLPSNHANWTQALLFLAILRRGSKYKLVAFSHDFSAFVDADGTLLMCGKPVPDTTSEFELAGTINQSIPTPVAGLVGVRVQSVVAQLYHIIALSVDGIAFSWGYNSCGQLGHGDLEKVAQPKAIRALSNVCAIATGFFHSLAITLDGALWSWGSNEHAELGHGDFGNQLLPRRLEALASKRMCAAAAAYTHSLAACVDGGCFAWGHRTDSGSSRVAQPQRIRALCGEHVSGVAASECISCVVTRQGDIWQWGKLGRVCLEPTPLRGTLLDTHQVVSVSCYRYRSADSFEYRHHCLALTADGTVFSWGVAKACDSEKNLERLRQVLGHGDAVDAPCTRFSMPRPIEALAGQHICSVVTTPTSGFAAGWTDGHAQRPQWACWSWGYNTCKDDWQALGHGEQHADTSLPRRVVGIGNTPTVTE